MILADLVRAAMLFVLVGVWIAQDQPPAWSLIGCVLVLAAGQALFRPALQATLPALIDDISLLPAANALLDTTERIARLLGPGVVGVASSLLPLVHFVTIDAVTFVVSAATILGIIALRPQPAPAAQGGGSVIESIGRGFVAARRHKVLGFMCSATAVINGAWYTSFFVGLPLMIAHAGVTGPGGSGLAAFGLVISGYGSTNLATTLVVGNWRAAAFPGRRIFIGNFFLGSGIVLLAASAMLVPTAWLLPCFIGSGMIAAIGGPLHDVTLATLRQTALPRGDIPAVVRAFMVMNQLGILASLLVAPSVFDGVGVPAVVMFAGVAVLAVSTVGMLTRGRVRAGSPPGPSMW
jgi:hypothetical protein